MKSQGKIEMEAVTLPSVDQALFDVVVAAFLNSSSVTGLGETVSLSVGIPR